MKKRDISICQSCGMPMEEKGRHGTNADGTASREYCTHCYRDGEFTAPDLTVDGMIKHIAKVTGQKLTPEEMKKSRKFLSSLKRWMT